MEISREIAQWRNAYRLQWWEFLRVGDAEGKGPAMIPRSLREEWKFDRFYTQHADAGGVPVVASRKVDRRALAVAARIVLGMTSRRPEILASLVKFRVRVTVIGKTEEVMDLPDYADMRRDGVYWNQRVRGFGPVKDRPACSCGEENLLRLRGDRYPDENILAHELAHAIHDFGLRDLDPDFDRRLYATYSTAMRKGLWWRTYAASSWDEYWAEGVQSYFHANAFRWIPDGIHNDIDTRAKLRRYDPGLFHLIDRSLNSPKWSWRRAKVRS